MNNNCHFRMQIVLLMMLFSISVILCIDSEVTIEETLDAREKVESKEFKHFPVAKVRDNYRNDLLKKAKSENSTCEDFDVLIRTQAKQIKTGKSFNGSTLLDIKSRALQFGYNGWHTVVVFVNHLDEAIDDLTMYDKDNTTYNPAPNSVPPRTQEVFTFAHPTSGFSHGYASFSYLIPSLDIRIAAISSGGGHFEGLAFIPKGTDMKTYYESYEGIEGSSVWGCCGWVDRNLSVGYKNFYARMFAHSEEKYKATLRIELIKFSFDD